MTHLRVPALVAEGESELSFLVEACPGLCHLALELHRLGQGRTDYRFSANLQAASSLTALRLGYSYAISQRQVVEILYSCPYLAHGKFRQICCNYSADKAEEEDKSPRPVPKCRRLMIRGNGLRETQPRDIVSLCTSFSSVYH